MTYQDIVFSVGLLFFSLSMLPTIRENYKLKRCGVTYVTSFITSATQFVFSVMFITLQLYFSALMDGVLGTLWFIILLQRYVYGRSK